MGSQGVERVTEEVTTVRPRMLLSMRILQVYVRVMQALPVTRGWGMGLWQLKYRRRAARAGSGGGWRADSTVVKDCKQPHMSISRESGGKQGSVISLAWWLTGRGAWD